MRRVVVLAAAAVFACASTGVLAAEHGRNGAFNFRMGGYFPTTDSDFFKEQENAYSFDGSDLNGVTGGVGYTATLNNYVELDVNADFFYGSTRSADADFEDQNGNLILHDSRLSVIQLTVGFRVLPFGRYGRRGQEGRHYVRRPAPYLGAGVGMAYWQYEEEGDFVFADPSDPSGFTVDYDRVLDSGLEFETHVQAGIDFPIGPDWNLTLEARRSWAEANLSDAFPSTAISITDPRKLDLGGYSLLFGASVRF